MKAVKIKRVKAIALSVATIGATIFETRRCPGAKARRTPTNKSANAIANNKRLAHGKSRVIAQLTKISG